MENEQKNAEKVTESSTKSVEKVVKNAENPEILAKNEAETPDKTLKTAGNKQNSRLKKAFVVFLMGIFVLIVGLVVFLGNLFSKPGLRDAEYLVEIGAWVREDEPGVIWNFTEVGEGSLTTNNHENDYGFIWALEGEVMKVETDWLATLNDEYIYKVNQVDRTLTLKNELGNWTFVPLDEADEE